MKIEIEGNKLLVDGDNYIIKGICWNPTPIGMENCPDYKANYKKDIDMMAKANINTIRLYWLLDDIEILDYIHSKNMKVIVNQTPSDRFDEMEYFYSYARKYEDHPAILMYMLGNEFNANNLYAPISIDSCVILLNNTYDKLKKFTTRPITISIGSFEGQSEYITLVSKLKQDIVSIQCYAYDIQFTKGMIGFHSIHTSKPLFLSEYGNDSYNSLIGKEDQESQNIAVREQTKFIRNSCLIDQNCIGGCLFEFNDEWWKMMEDTTTQSTNGIKVGNGGPYPDQRFNEEWFGIVDIYRKPKKVFNTLKEIYSTY